MKKALSLAASLMIAASGILLPTATAAEGDDFLAFQRRSFLENYSSDVKKIEAMAEKEDEMDFNSDGKFDMWDVYAYYRGYSELVFNTGMTYVHDDGTETYEPPVYEVPEQIKEKVSKYGDFSGDGKLDYNDFDLLFYYYSLNYPVSYDFVDPDYYYYHCPDNILNNGCEELFENKEGVWTIQDLGDSINGYMEKPLIQFILDYVDRTSRIGSSYSVFCDMVDRGILDLDINGDGEYTFSDLNDIFHGLKCFSRDESPEYGDEKSSGFSKEEWERLGNTCLVSEAALGYAFEGEDYYVAYLFEHSPFKKAYADKHYFEGLRGSEAKDELGWHMRNYLSFTYPGVYFPRADFTQEEIRNDFINYYNKVMDGTLPEPDINMNGTIEFEDYIYADLILAGDYLPDMSKYPDFSPEIIENFRNNCDFNENEMSGDLSDVISIQLYVVKKLGIPEDEVKNEMARYYKKHLDIDVYDYEHYVLPEEKGSASASTSDPIPEFDGSAPASRNVPAIRSYMSNIELFRPKNGDANNDGSVDMSDSVLIMQALANPDKYGENGTSENHITLQGRTNGDMDGDGLTVGDAQAIQQMLLGIN